MKHYRFAPRFVATREDAAEALANPILPGLDLGRFGELAPVCVVNGAGLDQLGSVAQIIRCESREGNGLLNITTSCHDNPKGSGYVVRCAVDYRPDDS
jgi:hypothetical protein